jgi:hypothetical protein
MNDGDELAPSPVFGPNPKPNNKYSYITMSIVEDNQTDCSNQRLNLGFSSKTLKLSKPSKAFEVFVYRCVLFLATEKLHLSDIM